MRVVDTLFHKALIQLLLFQGIAGSGLILDVCGPG